MTQRIAQNRARERPFPLGGCPKCQYPREVGGGWGLSQVAKLNPPAPTPHPPPPIHPPPPRRRNLSIKINSSKAQLLRLQKEADPLSRQPQLERQLAQQRKKALSAVSSAASFGVGGMG